MHWHEVYLPRPPLPSFPSFHHFPTSPHLSRPYDQQANQKHSLAYAELYLTTAILVNKFDLELYETDRKDVDMHKDGFVAMPVNESKGVRVKVKSVRD